MNFDRGKNERLIILEIATIYPRVGKASSNGLYWYLIYMLAALDVNKMRNLTKPVL